MKKINCALIGVGYWGSKLKKYIEANLNFNLKYFCDSKFNLNKIWDDNSITAVIIATPNNTHYEIVKSALLNNKNVLSEKPLALSNKECVELKELSEDKKLVLFTQYTFTFSRALQKAFEWFKNRKIGDLLGIEMNVKHLGRFGGENVYWLLGSHMLSVLDMFISLKDLSFNRRDIVIYNSKIETGTIEFDSIRTELNIHGQITVSLNCPFKEIIVILYGEYGTIVYNPLAYPKPLQLTTYKRIKWTTQDDIPQKVESYIGDEKNNLKYAIETFYDVLSGNKESNLETAVEVSRILEMIQR
jgi:predicted dehydrogenase